MEMKNILQKEIEQNERAIDNEELAQFIVDTGTNTAMSISYSLGYSLRSVQRKVKTMIENGEISFTKCSTTFSNKSVFAVHEKKYERSNLFSNELKSGVLFFFRKNGFHQGIIRVNEDTKNWHVEFLIHQFEDEDEMKKFSAVGVKMKSVIQSVSSSEVLTYEKPQLKKNEQLIIVCSEGASIEELSLKKELRNTIFILKGKTKIGKRVVGAFYVDETGTISPLNIDSHALKVQKMTKTMDILSFTKESVLAENQRQKNNQKLGRKMEE